MAKTHNKKLKPTVKSEPGVSGETPPKIKKKIVKKKTKSLKKPQPPASSPISEPDFDPAEIPAVLETLSREQLIDLISAAASDSPPLRARVARLADLDVSKRKLFVHGLPWNASNEMVVSEFQGFGEVEDCKVLTDKTTGRAKGYAFITLKTSRAVQEALRDPKRMVNNRLWSWQLASVGPANSGSNPVAAPAVDEGGEEVGARKIYVSNVGKTVEKERLRVFFSRFGELEAGPLGFDPLTGKSRGYALFIYKTVEGARKALEEPCKIFEGQQWHCSVAKDGTSKSVGVGVSGGLKPQQPHQHQVSLQPEAAQQEQMLAAMAAAQSLAMFGRHSGLNPLAGYSGLMGNSVSAAGGGSSSAMINPLAGYSGLMGNLASAAGGSSSAMINPLAGYSHGMMGSSQVGALGLGSQNLLGGYRFGQSLPSVYSYPSMQLGQAPTAGRGYGTGFPFP